MGAVVEIWLESLIPFLQRDSRIVQWQLISKLLGSHTVLEQQSDLS